LLTRYFILAAIAVGQLFNSLAQTIFSIKLKPSARDSLVMAAKQFLPCCDRQNYGNHICFFCIALADCNATYLEQFLSINYRVNIVTMLMQPRIEIVTVSDRKRGLR
jgi:hypothetical protein